MPRVRPRELRAPHFASEVLGAGQREVESAAVWAAGAASTMPRLAFVMETSSGATASLVRAMQWLLCSRLSQQSRDVVRHTAGTTKSTQVAFHGGATGGPR